MKKISLSVLSGLLFFVITALTACDDESKNKNQTISDGGTNMSITVSSPEFTNEAAIPKKFSCDGEDISPAISWSGLPEGTESLALISDDPDAPVGTWVHWVIYNIPADLSGLPSAVPTDKKLDNGALQGKNSWGRIGYGGPCPPGGTHRYFFKLYALDSTLDLEAGLKKNQLIEAMAGHILAQGQLMGTFSR